jgi:hypothetical protein
MNLQKADQVLDRRPTKRRFDVAWAGTDDHDQGPLGSAVDATAAARSRSSCPIVLEVQLFTRIVAIVVRGTRAPPEKYAV